MCIISKVVFLCPAVDATILYHAPVIDVVFNGALSFHTKLLSLFK